MHADSPEDYEEAEREEEIVARCRETSDREIERILTDPAYAHTLYRELLLNKERDRIWTSILKYIPEGNYAKVESIIWGQ